jgi:hypothetical protein
MRRSSRIALGLGVLVVCIVVLIFLSRPPAFFPPAIAQGRPLDDPLRGGTASCSGRGCHGRVEPACDAEPTPSSMSYTTWFRDDKHADAYEALLSPAGQQIAERLGLESAAASERCLACHTKPAAAVATAPPALLEERRFGVGCEACHGAARDWIQPHCGKKWQELNPTARKEEYDSKGMIWLRSPTIAARVCAGCHVGDGPDPETGRPARDVNHDLIAAGHPRLAFEYSTYLANMPRHWQEKPNTPGSEARAWGVGQVMCAQADLDLLAYRASSGGPWPEFAAYDCASCHHDLHEPSWRRERANRDHPPGAMRPATWYDALLPVAVVAFLPNGPAPPDTSDLRAALARPLPDRAEVARLAGINAAALTGLAAKIEQSGINRSQLVDLRKELAVRGQIVCEADWDELQQVNLALMAVSRAYHDSLCQAGENPKETDWIVDAAIREAARRLAFPVGYRSPKQYRRDARYNIELEELFRRISR